jgi:hypothetical protein
VGALLVGGAVLAPSTDAQPTRTLVLVVAVAAACVALALWRPASSVLVGALLVLIVIDGARELNDYRSHQGRQPWALPPSEARLVGTDNSVRQLPFTLSHPPPARPPRVAPVYALSTYPTGTDPDTAGWVGAGYHLTDYGSTIETARWRAEHNRRWVSLLLAPWLAFTWSCAEVGCTSGRVHLPLLSTWKSNPAVQTLSYGAQRIVYSVYLAEPELMVENELAIRGWRADRPGVRVVDAGIPLRAWRLPAGRYVFTANYTQPGQLGQLVAVFVALVAWLAAVFLVFSRGAGRMRDWFPRAARAPGEDAVPRSGPSSSGT